MLPRTQALSGWCFCVFVHSMKDAVQVSAIGRSPEMYIEPVPWTLPSRSLATQNSQVSLISSERGASPAFLETSEQKSRTNFFQLSALQWRRPLKMLPSFANLDLFGDMKSWAILFAVLVLVWVFVVFSSPKRSFSMAIDKGPPIQNKEGPSECSEQQQRLIKELESSVRQSGARLPRGLIVDENTPKPQSPGKAPPEEVNQFQGPFLKLQEEIQGHYLKLQAMDLSWVNGMVDLPQRT